MSKTILFHPVITVSHLTLSPCSSVAFHCHRMFRVNFLSVCVCWCLFSSLLPLTMSFSLPPPPPLHTFSPDEITVFFDALLFSGVDRPMASLTLFSHASSEEKRKELDETSLMPYFHPSSSSSSSASQRKRWGLLNFLLPLLLSLLTCAVTSWLDWVTYK